jgi:glutathione S-transferase
MLLTKIQDGMAGRLRPEHQDPALLASGIANWNRHMQMLEGQLAQTQAYATGDTFTLADIVLGLSAQRWLVAPTERPDLPAVHAYCARLSERAGFLKHGANGMP